MKKQKRKVLDLNKTTITVLKNPAQIIGGTSDPLKRTWILTTRTTTSDTVPGKTGTTRMPRTTSETHPTTG